MGKQHHDIQNNAQEAITAPAGDQTANTPTSDKNASGAPQGAALVPVLSDEDKDRIQRMTKAIGARRAGLYKLPNGDIRLDVTIPVESAAILESQAECAGEDLEQFVQRNVVEALMAYICSAAG
jgi:hypothetical protein